MRVFYFFARTADDIADHASIKKKEKLRILNFFDNCLKHKKRSEISVLNNLISYKFINEIHVYDLGMDDDIVAKVKSISPDINVFKFQFSQYEEFISKRDMGKSI